MRIHLDPAPTEGTGAGTPAPDAPANPASPSPPPANPNVVQVDRAAYEADRLKLAEFVRARDEAERSAQEARERALIDKGKWEEVVRMRDDSIADAKAKLAEAQRHAADVEKASARFVLGESLNKAIAARTDLSPGAAEMIAESLAGHLEAKRINDQWHVTTIDGRSPADLLASFLQREDRQFLLKASSKGGPPVDGGSRTPAPSSQPDANASDFRARKIAEMKARQSGQGGQDGLWNRLPAVPTNAN